MDISDASLKKLYTWRCFKCGWRICSISWCCCCLTSWCFCGRWCCFCCWWWWWCCFLTNCMGFENVALDICSFPLTIIPNGFNKTNTSVTRSRIIFAWFWAPFSPNPLTQRFTRLRPLPLATYLSCTAPPQPADSFSIQDIAKPVQLFFWFQFDEIGLFIRAKLFRNVKSETCRIKEQTVQTIIYFILPTLFTLISNGFFR